MVMCITLSDNRMQFIVFNEKFPITEIFSNKVLEILKRKL